MHDTYTDSTSQNSRRSNDQYHTTASRPGLLTCLFSSWAFTSLLILALQIATGIRTAHAENSQPGSGVLLLHHSHGKKEAIQLDADIELSVQGFLAEMTLKQTFQNTSDQWLEGSYLFPLPEESAIRGLMLQIGDRTILGKVETRKEAQDTYTTAKEAGQIAGLIEQQRPNLFKMKVASIAPGDFIEVKLDILIPVKYENDRFVITLPTTLTPRYGALATGPEADVQSPFGQTQHIRGPRLNLNARIAPIKDHSSISSATHILQKNKDSISLTDIPMDRDIELSWVNSIADKEQIHAFVSSHKEHRYVQILLSPPGNVAKKSHQSRELIMVIDKSGSMAGVSMDAAKEALHYAVDGLQNNDYVNIIAFDDNSHSMYPSSRMVDEQTKRHARQFIEQLDADGGTEMQSALSLALTPSANTETLRQVVFLTDGSVAYEDAMLAQIKRQLGDSRLFTIGIGPAPNTWFLEKAAQAGRGIALSIQDSHDVAASMTDLLSNLAHPVLTHLSIQYPSGNGELYPRPIPDLYANKPGMLVTRISDTVERLELTGRRDGERWRQTINLKSRDRASGAKMLSGDNSELTVQAQKSAEISNAAQQIAPAVAMHWSRLKIASLMDEQRYAVDTDLHKSSITELALDVGLVSPYTSFVAVDSTREVFAPANQAIARVSNLIPAGNQMMSIAMPQGAAGSDTLAAISLLFGFSGFALCALARSKNA